MSDFVHKTYEAGQTIAAIATPPGQGGIAIIRISGNEALSVADRVFSGDVFSYKSHTAHLGNVLDSNGAPIDEVLLLIMKGKRSFTGEDTVEIHCHGGQLVTRRVLERILRAGARAALPGEFSFKAFRNGKIDLTQAEAIQSVISAKSEAAMQTAEMQLQGKLHTQIASFQKDLFDIAAILEAWVDFPEEGLEFASFEEIETTLTKIIGKMKHLESTFRDGKVITSTPTLCLLGKPNAGKSSLLNALCGKDRAIVTHIPGTTRDVLETTVQIGPLTFELLDTAGLRETDEVIEKEGIARSHAAAKDADLILLVVDATEPFDETIFDQIDRSKTIIAWNKIDLSHNSPINHPRLVQISAKKEEGIDTLKKMITATLLSENIEKDEVMITKERHYEALRNATTALEKVVNGLREKTSPEFISIEIKDALKELGTIIGTNVTEEVLSAIFSKFCVGK